jgi:hypothetical protein
MGDGSPLPSKTHVSATAPRERNKIDVGPLKRDAFAWYELKLIGAGAGGGLTAMNSERIFFSPTMDATIPIAEGPAPADWSGYHTGKHGVYERFTNLKGEEVSLGELFYNEKYRWVRSQYLNGPNELKTFTAREFQDLLDRAYKNAPRETEDLSGLFDSEKFTADVKSLFDKYKADPKSTIWQAKYVYKNFKTGEIKGYGELQTNVDFVFEGSHYRIAVDAQTGKALNFFRIDPNPKFGPMKFHEVVLKWVGKITDVNVHVMEGEALSIEISATWTGLFKQGIKGGAVGGGLVAAFFGAADGLKKQGLIGGLKGLAVGGLVGAGIGGATGGVIAILSRIWPVVGKIAKIGGAVLTGAAILLDAADTGLDPQEWSAASSRKDEEGNRWQYRHIKKQGSFLFPEYVPSGIRITGTDKTVFEFGDNEYGIDSSYADTPITTYAAGKLLRWHMLRTPAGSSLWYWQDLNTKEEFAVAYRDDATMKASLAKSSGESGFRFTPTRN